MWHDQTVPRNEVLAPIFFFFFFFEPLSLQLFQPLSVQALKQRKHSCCSCAISEFRNSFFNVRGDDLAAAPQGTLNKQKKSPSAKFEVTPANRRLGSAATRLFWEPPQCFSYITGQMKACYSFLELREEVLALVLGMDRWSLEDVVALQGTSGW